MKMNKLNGPQRFTLQNWLNQNWDKPERKTSMTKLASHLSMKLGFTVTRHNIDHAVAVIGKTWEPSFRGGEGTPNFPAMVWGAISDMRERLTALENVVTKPATNRADLPF